MDPNAQNPQGDSSAVNKLEQDLQNIKDQDVAAPQQPIPVEEPVQPFPQIPEVPQVVPATSTPPVTPVETSAFVPESPKKGSPLMIVAIILAVIAVLAVVIYVLGAKFLTPGTKQTACTMEAKVCPDGSSVGRTGPNCEFAACPSPTATADPTANWKTYTNTVAGFGIKYPAEWAAINIAAGSNGSQALPNSIMIDISKIGKTEAYPEGLMSIQIFETKPSYPTTFTKSTGTINNQVYEKYSTVIDQQLMSETYLFSTMDKKTFVEALIRYKTGDTYKETFDQILSTFKFIQATPAGSPTVSPTSSPSATVTP